MAEKSMFWSAPTSGDGAAGYTEAEVTRLFQVACAYAAASEGIVPTDSWSLEVTGSASPLSVNYGRAFVLGFFYWSDAPVNVTVPTPVVGTTGHRVVLQLINANKTVRIALISSPDGTPGYPALTQTYGTKWEIPLANLTITTGGAITLVDARSFCHYSTKVNLGMMDNDSVDDTKAGNRVPQFYRRQGGSSTIWDSPGITTYTPGAVRMQAGTIQWTGSSAQNGYVDVTYPVPFSYAPVVFATAVTNNSADNISIEAVYLATGWTQVRLAWHDTINSHTTINIFWLAIGPE